MTSSMHMQRLVDYLGIRKKQISVKGEIFGKTYEMAIIDRPRGRAIEIYDIPKKELGTSSFSVNYHKMFWNETEAALTIESNEEHGDQYWFDTFSITKITVL